MALFNNIGNLMDILMKPDQHEEGKNLADQAGVDANNFSKIASIGLPLILQGMNRNNQDPKGLESFNQALNQHQERNNYDSLSRLTQNVDRQEGDKILGHVFSNEKDEVSNSLADRLGLDAGTVNKALAVLAPIALKYLADRKKEQNLDAQGIQQETQKLTREAAMQAKDYNQNQLSDSNGLLGELFDNLTGSTNKQKKDDGLLGNLFDVFK